MRSGRATGPRSFSPERVRQVPQSDPCRAQRSTASSPWRNRRQLPWRSSRSKGRGLLEALDSGGEHGRSLAELGIGTNPAAMLTGNVLEDEKVIGTAHLAFGTSAGMGGVDVASVHIDGVVLRPTLELDGACLLDDGRLLVP